MCYIINRLLFGEAAFPTPQSHSAAPNHTSGTMSPPSKANLFTYTPLSPSERFARDPLLFLATWIYSHQCPIAIPTPSKEPIRIVCVSDAHTACPALPSGDILIHAGDLTNNGTFPELQRQLNWLSSRPHPHKLAIAGNHDLLLDPSCYDKHKDLFAPPLRVAEKDRPAMGRHRAPRVLYAHSPCARAHTQCVWEPAYAQARELGIPVPGRRNAPRQNC